MNINTGLTKFIFPNLIVPILVLKNTEKKTEWKKNETEFESIYSVLENSLYEVNHTLLTQYLYNVLSLDKSDSSMNFIDLTNYLDPLSEDRSSSH